MSFGSYIRCDQCGKDRELPGMRKVPPGWAVISHLVKLAPEKVKHDPNDEDGLTLSSPFQRAVELEEVMPKQALCPACVKQVLAIKNEDFNFFSFIDGKANPKNAKMKGN